MNEGSGTLKSVLVIAHSFPPTGGSGVQRTLKFVKYLPSFRWRPIVLTPGEAGSVYHDESLADEIPLEAKVYRTVSFEPYKWYSRLRKSRASDLIHEEVNVHHGDRMVRRLARSIGRALFGAGRYVALNLVFVPDFHIGWIPFAVARGLRIIHKEKVSVIYATGDPWSDFLIGLSLKYLTARPLVLDMRDPWSLATEGVSTSRIRNKIEGFWERRCIAASSKVINVTEGISQAYVERYPHINEGRFVCLTNGFDEHDFDGMAAGKTERFTISSTGAFVRRTPRPFFKGVRYLLDHDTELASRLGINFMGAGGKVVGALVREYQLGEIVNMIPYGAHRDSIQLLMDSDVLLLVLDIETADGTNRLPLTAKVFEYLAARKPILAVVPPESAAAKIVESANAGVVVDPDDVPGIARAISELYSRYEVGSLGLGAAGDLRRYERKELTGRLAGLLDGAILRNSR